MKMHTKHNHDALSALEGRHSGIGSARDYTAHMPRSDTVLSVLLRHIAYPMLVIAAISTIAAGIKFELNFGHITLFFLIGTVTYLAILERLIPFEADWHPSAREWVRYGVYFLLTMVAGGLASMAGVAISSAVSPQQTALPLWLEIPLAVVIRSLGIYLFHRLAHVHPWLWRLHGVHHVPQKVNVANNSVNSLLDVFGHQVFSQLTLILLGFSQPAFFAVTIFTITQGFFSHANIDVRIGWFNYILASPEQHRLHHSTDLDEAGHYCTDLALWDLLFGSFTWRPHRRPAEVGVQDPASFPHPSAILSNYLFPWRSPKTYGDSI
jgi:sterol desaturase/sphingolipid hydroxylase (fatty acid hydroxylase superfamily)